MYGLVNTGLAISDLLDPARRQLNRSEGELMLSEIITTLLQAEVAYEGVGETFFGNGLRRQCADAGLTEPSTSHEYQRELRRLRSDYPARWRALGVGETLEVELPRS